ncbi:DNA repair protein REV1-like [Humulus lupulus]|uniref:DNA repair protein REV1-like n=1 Tax=Humulus lupulus TaxID=3486 RepID=UPI002B40F138|nr:DNA repair protein REV1-like [Humulus lupulus]
MVHIASQQSSAFGSSNASGSGVRGASNTPHTPYPPPPPTQAQHAPPPSTWTSYAHRPPSQLHIIFFLQFLSNKISDLLFRDSIRSFSGGLPVVKPTWVVDSVAASKLLSWVPYQLVQLADNQPRLSAFFATKLSVEDSRLVNYDNELTSNRGSLLTEEDYLSEVGEETEYINQNGGESDDTAHQKIQTLIEKPTIGSEKSLEMKIAHTYNLDAEDDSSVKDSIQGSPSQPSASLNNYCLEASPNSPAIGSYGCHSTLTDPNFVENYFKSSRLHFIGTWRNRYRKHFPCQSKWIKNTNSNPSSADFLRTTIIHIDMDCFFVSVVIKNDHNLKDKPVVVCHSDSPKGTAEISSPNYPAGVYGVRAGMFIRDAKALCPHLLKAADLAQMGFDRGDGIHYSRKFSLYPIVHLLANEQSQLRVLEEAEPALSYAFQK